MAIFFHSVRPALSSILRNNPVLMFHYTCVRQDDLPEISQNGLTSTMARPVVLTSCLEEMRQSCGQAILAVDGAAAPYIGEAESTSSCIPRANILHLDPYAPPVAVKAAGGRV